MAEYGVATISVLMPHRRLRPRAADPPRPWNTTQPSPINATHIGKRLAGKLHEPFERAGGGRAISPTSPDSTPLKPGNAGGGKGPQFKTNAASSEGPEIGKPSNSEKCSETTDSVTRESEGRSRLSLLRPVRQDRPRRHSGACLCPVPLQQGRTGSGRPGFCGHRGIRGRALAGGTGACAQAGELPAGAHQTSVYTEGQRQTEAAGYLDRAGSGLHDSNDAGAGADL